MTTETDDRPIGRTLPILLLVLTVFGPISMDLYLPALPALTRELDAATSVAQLTVSACLIGLAVGQLIAGPLSDRLGRRTPLIIGVVGYVLASALCAASPTIETLIVARVAQGIAGGVGIVIAQAAGRDVYSGRTLIRFYGRLTVTGGLAAIVGPVLGGALTTVADWRGLFLFLSAVGTVILIAVVLLFGETLPVDRRTAGGRASRRDLMMLLSDRVFVGAVLGQGLVFAAIFAYLAGATFVLQDIYGLSPQLYAAAFGLNSAGFVAFGFLGGRAAEPWSVRGSIAVGLAISGLGACGLLLSGIAAMPLPVVIVGLFALASGAAFSSPAATTMALAEYPSAAGSASSLLGSVRYGFGGATAPLVGLAGASSILPLGLVTVTAILLAAGAFAVLGRRARNAAEPESAPAPLVAP